MTYRIIPFMMFGLIVGYLIAVYIPDFHTSFKVCTLIAVSLGTLYLLTFKR